MNFVNYPLTFSTLSLWLLLIWVLQKTIWKKQGIGSLLLIGCLAAALLLLPIQGLSVACWMRSFVSSWSVPFAGLLLIAILEHAFSRRFFSAIDWKVAWFFGVGASLLLYPSALGLGKMDAYTWGWSSSSLFIAVGLIALLLILLKNRFALLLVFAFVSYLLGLQSSNNFWDYLIDPFYGGVAIVMTLRFSYFFLKSKS